MVNGVIGRSLHRYRKDHCFRSHSCLNFQASFDDLVNRNTFLSAFQAHFIHILNLLLCTCFTGLLSTHIMGQLHRYRGGQV